jgi:hypothetical protein
MNVILNNKSDTTSFLSFYSLLSIPIQREKEEKMEFFEIYSQVK